MPTFLVSFARWKTCKGSPRYNRGGPRKRECQSLRSQQPGWGTGPPPQSASLPLPWSLRALPPAAGRRAPPALYRGIWVRRWPRAATRWEHPVPCTDTVCVLLRQSVGSGGRGNPRPLASVSAVRGSLLGALLRAGAQLPSLFSPARPQRHGLAVCLALTTMCTSLLLMYSSLGGLKERPPQQQQQPATGSAQPAVESSPQPGPGAPARPRPLDGYLGVADHKVTARPPAQAPLLLGIPRT